MDDEELPSKSQVKREMRALRDFGARLTALNPAERDELPLGARLRSALDEYDRLRAREARRRHLSFVGKLLREEDVDAIAAGVERMDAASAVFTRELHVLETWRDALLADDAALGRFLDEHPHADRPRLRNAVRAARSEARSGSGDGARRHYRALYRLLREEMRSAGTLGGEPGADEGP